MRDHEGDAGLPIATSFGYHVRRRRLALDLTQAALAGRVGCSAAMIKKIEHDERRPSRRMAERLAESLGVSPDGRARFVAVAVGERTPRDLSAPEPGPTGEVSGPSEPGVDPAAPPAWLMGTAHLTAVELAHSYVGRDVELERLDGQLRAAVDGDGRVVFVTGEAGQGKTSLLTAFAARAHAAVPGLVVAAGHGTAASGLGDPYLPFRDLLLMLLADPNALWQPDRLAREQLERLWRFAPQVARTLLATAPRLLDVLVPAALVRERAGSSPRGDGPADGAVSGPARGQLFAELTAALQTLSRVQPLLLLLDDLQWIDAASAELLFHLARSVGGSRLLLVGAYRESEVAAAGTTASETLHRTRLEIERELGDVGIDLEAVGEDDARRLCDALVDREPNALGDAFRRRLFAQTRGHPLFTLELLHELRRRGDLLQDPDAGWVVADALDWHALPGRVAAAVEQRLRRLDDEVRVVLDVAAVVGEQFTAEVVADVCDLDAHALIRRLSTELAGVHGLVREAGTRRAGGHQLTQWRFSHALFQQYLYGQLAEGERRHLHREVAGRLEVFHGADGDLVPRLAYHYGEAGDADRALPYLLRAGDRARALYATDEAVHHYRAAVELLRGGGDDELLARTLMKLGLSHEIAFDRGRAQAAYDEAFRLWRTVGPARPGPATTATLRMLWREPESLDPTRGGYNLTAPVATQLFSGLVTFGDEGEILPDVAHRWELEDDGRRYVFHLRDDVAWSDGAPVTSEDFVFTYRRALDPRTRAATASSLLDAVRGARAVRGGEPLDEVELGIRAEDGHTLVVELEEPTSYFLQNLAYYVLLPTPRHAVEAHGDAWASPEHLVGNGPFVIASWEPGRSMVLERNPRYHGAAAGNIGRVELLLDVPEEEHASLYEDDRTDVLRDWFTPPAVITRLAGRHPDDYVVRPEHTTICLLLNASRPPLDDRRVRRALGLAVDRESLLPLYPPGAATAATGGLVPPGMPGHVAALQPAYDPREAARLLGAAGATADAGGRPLVIEVPSRGAGLAEAVARGWRSVGMACEVVTADRGAAGDDPADQARWDAAAGGWVADYADPDNFLRVFVGLNLTVPVDDHLDLLDRAALSRDQQERLHLYQEAERLLAREAVIVPLVYRATALLLKPWVKRFVTPAVKHVGFWKDVTVDR